MKIAITYDQGNVFQHFGKTEEFKIYEIVDGNVIGSEVTGTEGASHHDLAGFLASKGVAAVICGGVGQGMVNALAQYNIMVFAGAQGNADDVMQAFLEGYIVNNTTEGTCHCHEHHDHEEGGCHCHDHEDGGCHCAH